MCCPRVCCQRLSYKARCVILSIAGYNPPVGLKVNRFRPATGQRVRWLQFAPFKVCPLAERKAYRANAQGAATAPTKVPFAVHTFSTSRVVYRIGTQSAPGVCCLPSIAVVAIGIAVLRFSYDDFRKQICFPS